MNQENDNFLVVDFETSGINPFRHQVLAVALVPVDRSIPPLSVYVREPAVTWSTWAFENFQRFKKTWEAQAVAPSRACEDIETFLRTWYREQPATLVGHNVGFDMAFLRRLAYTGGRDDLAGLSHRAIDTHTLLYAASSSGLLPAQIASSEAAFKFFQIHIPESERHTALGDALATRRLFLELKGLLGSEMQQAAIHGVSRSWRG